MYNFLKILLKQIGVTPTDKTESSVKTRVVQYIDRCERNPYYVAQYKRFGAWNNFTCAFITFNDPTLWNYNHPVLDQNFEKLVEFCKTFKSHKEINDYHNNEKLKYEQALNKFNEEVRKLGKCGRVWQSD